MLSKDSNPRFKLEYFINAVAQQCLARGPNKQLYTTPLSSVPPQASNRLVGCQQLLCRFAAVSTASGDLPFGSAYQYDLCCTSFRSAHAQRLFLKFLKASPSARL